MSKNWTPSKPTVELNAPPRPARRSIRREPLPLNQSPSRPDTVKPSFWQTREGEITLALIGIVIFALAINAILFGASATMGQ